MQGSNEKSNTIQNKLWWILSVVDICVFCSLVCSIQASHITHCICGVLELEVEIKCENTPRI